MREKGVGSVGKRLMKVRIEIKNKIKLPNWKSATDLRIVEFSDTISFCIYKEKGCAVIQGSSIQTSI